MIRLAFKEVDPKHQWIVKWVLIRDYLILGKIKQIGKSDDSKKKFKRYEKYFEPVNEMASRENSLFIKEATKWIKQKGLSNLSKYWIEDGDAGGDAWE